MANASTTVTPTWGHGQNVRKIACSWICDDATGEPLNAVTPKLEGWIERVTYVPDGTTPPTNNVLHLVLSDEDAAVLNTGVELDNLVNGVTTHWLPDVPIYVMGALTIRVQNNAVVGGKFKVYVYVSK